MHSARMVATEPHLPHPGVPERARRRGAAWAGLDPTSSPADSVPERTCRKSNRAVEGLPRTSHDAARA